MEDLTYFYDRLKERHLAWLEVATEKTNAIEQLYQEAIASFDENVKVLDLYRFATKMASILRDGHTRISIVGEYKILDMADEKYSKLEIKSINGTELEELSERSKELLFYEMEAEREENFESMIYFQNSLELLGIDTSDGVTIEFNNGQTQHFNFISLDEYRRKREASKKKEEQNKEKEQKWVSYKIDKKHNLGIFVLKQCEYNDEYCSTLDKFFNEVQKKNIKNIVVDLRDNDGGSSQVAEEFISYLNHKSYQTLQRKARYGDRWEEYGGTQYISIKEYAFSGNVYVLTNAHTYSAATDFAMLIGDNKFGEIVGETSNNLPHCYIDILPFKMPHTKIHFTISYKIAYRIDHSKEYEPLTPDYITESSKALDKVYELIKDKAK